MKKCPKCGCRLEDDQLVCPNCKAKLPKPKKVKKQSNTIIVKSGKSSVIMLGARDIDARNASLTPKYIKNLIFTIPFFCIPAGAVNLCIFVWEILNYNNVANFPKNIFGILSLVVVCFSAVAFILSLILQISYWRWIETKAPAKVKSIFTPSVVYAAISMISAIFYTMVNHFIYTLTISFLCGLFMVLTGPTLFKQYNLIKKSKVDSVSIQPMTDKDSSKK